MRPLRGEEQEQQQEQEQEVPLAIYHLHAQVIGRSSGKSSVAAAAYRLGVRMDDERTGLVHDYTRKGGVSASLSLAPANAPDWASEPEKLWREVERVEKRKDAQLCREFDIAIPKELNQTQAIALVRSFVEKHFVAEGMCATVAFHHLGEGNPHAHVMTTLRDIGPEGFGNKNRDWNRVERLEAWREGWAKEANQALNLAQSPARIDHRSLEAQGITNRPPTKHLGKSYQFLRKGLESPRIDEIRTAFHQVKGWMRELYDLRAELFQQPFGERLKQWREKRQSQSPQSQSPEPEVRTVPNLMERIAARHPTPTPGGPTRPPRGRGLRR